MTSVKKLISCREFFKYYKIYNTIQALHTGNNPVAQYALLQYEHVFRQRGHICCLVYEKNIKGGNKKEVLVSPFNKLMKSTILL